MLVDVVVVVDVDVYMVFVDDVVTVGEYSTVVEVYEVTTGGVVTDAGPSIPVAGETTAEANTITETVNSKTVSDRTRKSVFKAPIS